MACQSVRKHSPAVFRLQGLFLFGEGGATSVRVCGGGGGRGGVTARAPEIIPRTEGRFRMNHSVHIHANEPEAAAICVFKHA
jgi:hypothetical protein